MPIPQLKPRSYIRRALESLYLDSGVCQDSNAYVSPDQWTTTVDTREFSALDSYRSHSSIRSGTPLSSSSSDVIDPIGPSATTDLRGVHLNAWKHLDTDFTLLCKRDGFSVRVHHWVLYARWQYFELLMNMSENTLEWQQRTLEFPEDTFDEISLRAFLLYLYTNVPNGFHSQSLSLELLKNAQLFHLMDLSTPATPAAGFELLIDHCRRTAFPIGTLTQPEQCPQEYLDDVLQLGSHDQLHTLEQYRRFSSSSSGSSSSTAASS